MKKVSPPIHRKAPPRVRKVHSGVLSIALPFGTMPDVALALPHGGL